MMDRDAAMLIKKVCEKKEIREFKVCNEEEKDKYLDFFEALDIHWRQGEKPNEWKPRDFISGFKYPYTLYPSSVMTWNTGCRTGAVEWSEMMKSAMEG